MRELGKYMFARSLAGHDKGRLYVVVGSENDSLLLADGRYRGLDCPKKKKRKHVQPDLHRSPYLEELEASGRVIRDEDIRKAVKIKEETTCQKQM